MSLRAAVNFIRASQCEILRRIKEAEGEEETLRQKLSVTQCSSTTKRCAELPQELKLLILSFLPPKTRLVFRDLNPTEDIDLANTPWERIKKALEVKPRRNLGVRASLPDLTRVELPAAWHDPLGIRDTNADKLKLILKNLKRFSSSPSRIVKAEFSSSGSTKAILPLFEGLKPYLLFLNELTMGNFVDIDNEEGLRDELTRLVAGVHQGSGSSQLKKCILQPSLLRPLGDAGMLKSLRYLQMKQDPWQHRLSFTDFVRGLSGLHKLESLDLYEFKLPSYSTEQEGLGTTIHLESLRHLLLPSPSFLDFFSGSATLLSLGIKRAIFHPILTYKEISRMFPQLEELHVVSPARDRYSIFYCNADLVCLFCQ